MGHLYPSKNDHAIARTGRGLQRLPNALAMQLPYELGMQLRGINHSLEKFGLGTAENESSIIF